MPQWADLGQALAGTHGDPLIVGAGPLEPGTTFTVTASNVLAQTSAFVMVGATAINAPFLGGTFVPNPAVVLPALTVGVAGSPSTFTLGPITVPAGTPAGGNIYFQTWIVDPVAPYGVAASNAIVGTTRGSLRDLMISSFDALLQAAAPPTTSLPIYTTQDFTNQVYVRNPACWAASIDLTGISPWNQAYANLRAGTLISPRHIAFAKHYPLSTTPGNNDIVFVTAANVPITRKLVAVTYPAADIGVGVLDADVPSDIAFYKVLPRDWKPFLPNTNNLPMLMLDQQEKALVRNMEPTGGSASYCFHKTPPNPARAQFSETLIGGDSGNPGFLVVNGEAILVLTHHYSTGGPLYTTHFDAVNAAMIQLGGGYQLTEFDLGAVPR
jgi:hypothetical protein